MKISTSDSKKSIDFSEWLNDKEIFVYAATSDGHFVSLTFGEKEMRELRKHLAIQIRKIKKDGKK